MSPDEPPSRDRPFKVASSPSEQERSAREELVALFRERPIPDAELFENLALFVNRQSLSRFLLLDQLYRQILDVNGVIMEFGVRWGRDLALFTTLRGLYEPYNYARRVIGFDTFEGYPSVHSKDGADDVTSVGAYSVSAGYEQYLEALLGCQERESPISHITKHAVIKGDASVTVPRYLEEHPETIISLAYLDFDIYEPTRDCLRAILPFLAKGSIVAFDQLNNPHFPGETLALKEVLGLDRYKLHRSPLGSYPAWVVIE